jgi:hypothetical protein
VGCTHDLILVAGFALLKAGRQNVAARDIGNRHARSTDFATQHHCSMGDDPHQHRRRLETVER